jgi:hypothetical protein
MHTAQRVLILNSPESYPEVLGELPQELQLHREAMGSYDFVHLFVKNFAELDEWIDCALKAVEHDALFWISYPKGSSGVQTDLNRDSLWEAMLPKGIRPVTQVSVDQTWSAVRFRPAESVGK